MAEIKWKGGWSSALGVSDMTYYKNDVVLYDNITYIATAISVAIGSPAPTADMSKWDTFVSGVDGTSGTSGTRGTSGTSGISPIGDLRLFTAGTAGTSWTFTHNLGTPRPIVQVWGTSGQVIVPAEITSLSNTQIRIDFPEAVAGTATIGNGYSGTSGTSGTSGVSPIGAAKVFTAGTAGTSWTFAHNLDIETPVVQVWGTSGTVIIPSQIRSLDANTVKVEFPVAVAGKVIIGNGFSGTSGTVGTSGTSGIGVPTGGTSGQFLVKNSSTSGDMSWANLALPLTVEMRRTLVTNINTAFDYLINFDILDTGTLSSIGLTQSSGVFTNTSSVTKNYIINLSSGIAAASNFLESNMYITKNGPFSGTNRVALTAKSGMSIAAAVEYLTTVITLAPSETFRCYHYAVTASAGAFSLSAEVYGHSPNYSTRLKITELK